MKKIPLAMLLLGLGLLAVFFTFYNPSGFDCLNADEIAHSYNAYSILKTGGDEHGAILPLRLKSFDDFKLPLYAYLTVPFIKIFGLNDLSTRIVANLAGISIVFVMFFLTRLISKNRPTSLVAAFLTAVSPALYLLSRQAHEGVLASLMILISLFFLVKDWEKPSFKNLLLTDIFICLATFAYHTGRIFLIFVVCLQIYMLIKKRLAIKTKVFYLAIILMALGLPFLTDLNYSANRVNNLFFTKNPGFQMRISEYLNEHPLRLWHNKLVASVSELTNRYFSQISPQFLFINGDSNYRFGLPDLNLTTPIEYLMFFIGLYYLFRNKQRHRYLLLGLFLVAPLNNAFTWQESSLNRSQMLFFPFFMIAAYGLCCLYQDLKKKGAAIFLVTVTVFLLLFFLVKSWDIYLFHYPKKAVVQRAWQCGYKQMAEYVENNYGKYNRFVISQRLGQPYIFLLYYLKYDPLRYQKQPKQLSLPDGYGFTQVEKFDKFDFRFGFDKTYTKTAYIGYPDQFNDWPIDYAAIKKIKLKDSNEEMFWIYESK